MTGPRIGGLFSGYGGLELGVQAALGGTIAWHAEIDPAPSKILAHHWPDVPNHGDITAIDWATVEPVDVLCGGSPCQDVSSAGKRAGMRAGTRSGLWAAMTDAIDQLRPRLVVWENVRGVLSAGADCGLEFCPGCMGDPGDGGPALRALGRVLGDLSQLGYDTQWCGLRAADVGAPHGRYRIFVLATDTQSRGRRPSWYQHDQAGPDGAPVGAVDRAAADTSDVGHQRGGLARDGRPGPSDSGRAAATDTERGGRDGRARGEIGRQVGRAAATGSGETTGRSAAAADPHEPGSQGSEPARGRHLPDRGAPADTAGDGRDARRSEPARLIGRPDAALSGDAPPDADRFRGERRRVNGNLVSPEGAGQADRKQRQRDGDAADHRGPALEWGQYEPAIRRWERVLGRPAPAPTEPGAKGGQRLSPRLVEFMMGLPEGWVTDVPGVSRNDQLKALGNGVVPQQAAAAVSWLLLATCEVAA